MGFVNEDNSLADVESLDACMSFGKGRICVRVKKHSFPSGVYSEIDLSRKFESHVIGIQYCDQDIEIRVDSLGELVQLANTMGKNLSALIKDHLREFCFFVGTFLQLGQILMEKEGREYLSEDFGLNIEENLPRVNKEVLTCTFTKHNVPNLNELLVSKLDLRLSDLAYEVKKFVLTDD